MTHAEATHDNRIGIAPTACPGELEALETHPDGAGAVGVYHCPACGRRVSLEFDQAGWRLLNDYDPDPRRAIAELAEAWNVKPLLARPEEPL